MYTQCPECATAFRVTADVLRKASGKVRCGGCGHAFNALLYLSESRPVARPAAPVVETLPELEPEPEDFEADSGDSAPRPTMSAAQSAALLKTLDQLAGEDIRIEDTGVEWRLLDNDEETNDDDIFADTGFDLDVGEESIIEVQELHGDAVDFSFGEEAPTDADGRTDQAVDTALFRGDDEARIDELLDDAPTPVDEFLTDTPADIDASEVFEDTGATEVESSDVFASIDHPDEDVLRFDDNTGLPDNYDLDAEPPRAATAVPLPEPPPPADDADEAQAIDPDFSLGDPDEWGDLLAEVGPVAAVVPPTDAETCADTGVSVALDIESTGAEEVGPDPDDTLSAEVEIHEALDLDAASAEVPTIGAMTLEQELAALPDVDDDAPDPVAAMGIDLSGIYETVEVSGADEAANDASGTDADDDAPAAAEALAESEARPAAEPDVEREAETPARSGARSEAPSEDAPEDAPEHDAAIGKEVDTDAGDDAPVTPSSGADILPPLTLEADSEAPQEDDRGKPEAGDKEAPRPAPSQAAVGPARNATRTPVAAAVAKTFPDSTGELEFELAEAQKRSDDDLEFDPTRTIVPPLTEEEQTVNMLIDQDLMRLALTDDDGMASTIVLEGKTGRRKPATGGEDRAAEPPKATVDSLFETIIMEGDFARTAQEQERLAAEAEARAASGEAVAAAAAEQAGRPRSRRMQYGIIAGIVVLVLLLAGQFVHQSRADLATIPAVGDAIGPIYRAVGAPIMPEWNVKGWRFEVTRGSMDGTDAPEEPAGLPDLTPGDDILRIYSRLGNNSGEALPYPLISVALTDRFEEVIGSKVLEPSEYLPAGTDTREMIPPGGKFEAGIAVAAPAASAAGYKLNVCYRREGGQLRCAIEDFR